jgi:hypothetical protein
LGGSRVMKKLSVDQKVARFWIRSALKKWMPGLRVFSRSDRADCLMIMKGCCFYGELSIECLPEVVLRAQRGKQRKIDRQGVNAQHPTSMAIIKRMIRARIKDHVRYHH